MCLKTPKQHTQSTLKAVVEPFGVHACKWSLLKGDTEVISPVVRTPVSPTGVE